MRLLPSFALLLCAPLLSASPTHYLGQAGTSRHPASPEPIYLIIRSDDAGMSHSVNKALEKLIATGLPVSVSVMFPTPWYQETVDLLKRSEEADARSGLSGLESDRSIARIGVHVRVHVQPGRAHLH